jgi:hypothetical protein
VKGNSQVRHTLATVISKLMLSLHALFVLFLLPATAQEERMGRLTDDYLNESLARDGNWSAEVAPLGVEYECRTCGGVAKAMIEVVKLEPDSDFWTFAETYREQRRLRCADLVTAREGRCVNTQAVDVRFGILRGFVSETVLSKGHETEIAYFYNEGGIGPEMIRAVIAFDREARLPPNAVELIANHMRKLTVAW